MLRRLVQSLFPAECIPPKPVISDDDCDVIIAFAHGQESLEDEAIDAHRRCLKFGDAYPAAIRNFMSEIDTPMPDVGYRRLLREIVIRDFPQPTPPGRSGLLG